MSTCRNQTARNYNGPSVSSGSAGALGILLLPSKAAVVHDDGFNTGRVLVSGKHVEHWVNGVRVLAYELGSREFQAAMVNVDAESWLADKRSGPFILEHYERSSIQFRTIKVRRLDIKALHLP
jgi:hypothetical protein